MGFAQAYYTSCESGLSGFAGFQFNAATAGLSAQVLREVEALTSYQPPRSLGYHPSTAEIAACPVNLVYCPEPTTVLANVVFVGLDSSHRLGNYFAHALIQQSGPDDFERVLPIEFWGSEVWAGDPVSGLELPELAELPVPSPSNPINRTGVDRFLAGRDRPEQLACLLTAAENAVLRQGRPIVIIEPDNSAAANWIAAISFLLPPDVARRMSFATYRHRPEYSDAHVIATLPDPDFEFGDPQAHSYVVFDAISGRVSEVPADPAAALLVRAGASRAAVLWERANELADIPGTSLTDRHPALVMAALLAGSRVSVTDLEVLSAWLGPNGGQLPPTVRSDLLSAFLDVLAVHPGGTVPEVVQVFAAGLDDLIDDDVALPEQLRRPAMLARAQRHPDHRVSALSLITGPDPDPALDQQLLEGIWPQGRWSAAEALDVVGLLGRAQLGVEPVRGWLIRCLVEPPREGDYLPSYLALCRAVSDGAIDGPLPGEAQRVLSSVLADSYPDQPGPTQELLRRELPAQFEKPAGPADAHFAAGLFARWKAMIGRGGPR
jgi:GTPase-associated protein 1, N-terminal domain type 2/GTPase-associated protein 1, middle domain/GTPase-associated protein 1, C-terminal domain